jgi:hypothetical protein
VAFLSGTGKEGRIALLDIFVHARVGSTAGTGEDKEACTDSEHALEAGIFEANT